jgi:hypothetical protein
VAEELHLPLEIKFTAYGELETRLLRKIHTLKAGNYAFMTVIRSLSQSVTIDPSHPFVIIGERINPTGRKKLAAEMAAWDFSRVEADALAQVQAGRKCWM